MAAEAVVGAIIQVLVEKLVTLSQEQISLVRHFKDDFKKLQGSLTIVQAFLHDAEEKQVTDNAVKTWLRELEDLAFDADNVFDEIDYKLLSKKVKKPADNKTVKEKVQSCFSCSSPISYRLKMGRRIKDINDRLQKINQLATAFDLQKSLASAQGRLDAYENREENAFAKDPIFLGRGNEVSEIVEMLITSRTSPDGQKPFVVLPIVGMGGQGKTTIAREVYHDKRVKSYFGDNRVWVYVSRKFDVRNILKNVLTSITTQKYELETQQDILKKLQEHVGAKKYLLVLDDVWNENREVWDGFVNSLSGISSASGYCMIITTRSEDVASIVKEKLPFHKLKGLHEDDCWSIIKAKAFRGSDIPSLEFEEIGKNIARKCQGLPLAAKVVGGLLSSKESKDEWMSIEKSWLSDPKNPMSNVLKLSFDHLPSPSLKKCFAYCSIFPKEYEIQKERLVELWMAEGFLQTNSNMETNGSKNFSFLLRNSLLQNVRSDDYGNVTHCSMHDLLHDLACSVLCEKDDVTESVCKRRYIGYEPSGDELSSIPEGQERYVRTLFVDRKVSNIKFFDDFESLHTLTLVGYDIKDLPTSINKLTHLRYLDISETSIKCLPNSIGELYHLQTFRAGKKNDVWGVWDYLEKFPDTLSYLISVRHLHIHDHTAFPPKIGKLTFLQTLSYFRVGGEKGCEISELGNLEDLKGKLEIRNLEKVRDKNEATSAGLIRKSGIYKMKLEWDRFEVGDEENDESVLEGLQPHPNLKSLWICGFQGKILPLWTSKMAVQVDGQCWKGLNNLVEIKLEHCSECEELPMLGHLPHLKFLYLKDLFNVKSIGSSFYGIDNHKNNIFHALKKLELEEMPNLKEWDEAGDLPQQPSEVMVFPRLEHLTIRKCNQLMRAPSHFTCLQNLKIDGMNSGLPLENICGMKLTTLTHLEIRDIEGLEFLPYGLLSNNHNLSKLQIISCPNMTHLVPFLRGGGAPSLRELYIAFCSSLRELPDDLHSLNTLESLAIHDCPNLKSIPYPSSRGGQQQGFTSLKELVIMGCVGLTDLPIKMMDSCALSLENLRLSGSSSLTNVSEVIGCLHKMNRLTYLYIHGVPKFNIFYNGKCLKMSPSSSDSDSSWNNISFNDTVDAMFLQYTSFRELILKGMERWECLPDGIQHLTSLQELSLSDFGIEALPEWFGNLSSLESLRLLDCNKLRHFPSKQAMQRLSKLTKLFINTRCPLLLKEEGSNNSYFYERPQIVDSELPKISHIPTIEVDF